MGRVRAEKNARARAYVQVSSRVRVRWRKLTKLDTWKSTKGKSILGILDAASAISASCILETGLERVRGRMNHEWSYPVYSEQTFCWLTSAPCALIHVAKREREKQLDLPPISGTCKKSKLCQTHGEQKQLWQSWICLVLFFPHYLHITLLSLYFVQEAVSTSAPPVLHFFVRSSFRSCTEQGAK